VNRKTATRTAVLWALIGVGAGVHPVAGQRWELDLRRVTIEREQSSSLTGSGELIPAGFGVSARHVWRSGLSIEFEVSRGSEDRMGAICGGFVMDPVTECIPETVRYSGGLVAVSFGWLFHVDTSSGWWLGIGPRGGIGAAWAKQTGRDTGETFSEAPLTLLIGLGAEVTRELPWYGLALMASVGADHLRPVVAECVDCWQVLSEPMPQLRMGLGLAWPMP
jgi:hypothetical protein